MSLVEVIIAIAILSIVIIPVMRSFVYSARFNARARTLQETTVAGQTIMENFKADAVANICQQFAADTFQTGGSVGVCRELAHVDGSDTHEYMIDGMKYADSNSIYDVWIKLTPKTQQYMTYHDNSDAYCDAVYMVSASTASDIYNRAVDEVQVEWAALPDKADTEPVTFDAGNIIFDRVIQIVIDSSGKTEVYETYRYKVDSCSYEIAGSTGAVAYFIFPERHVTIDDDSNDGVDHSVVIYDNSATKDASGGRAKLKNIYFYFDPLYTINASDNWISSDTVVVSSAYGEKVNFHAIKQKTNLSDTQLEVREDQDYNSKRIHFKLNGNLTMYDNLNVNVAKPSKTVLFSAPELEGGATRPGSALHTDTLQKTLIYEIKISIYREGSIISDPGSGWRIADGAQPILEMEGTIND